MPPAPQPCEDLPSPARPFSAAEGRVRELGLAFYDALCQRRPMKPLFLWMLILASVAGCVPREIEVEPPPPPVPTPPISEEQIVPIERPHIVITDINETQSADKKSVTVSGTLVNRGHGTTHEVYVHVEALSPDGAVVLSADSEPTTELIQPGSTAAFSVTLENRADVERYHVEAVSR